MSVLFNHACRYELFDRNPIYLVRQSAKRRRPPTLLMPTEIKTLVNNSSIRERTLVLLAVSTGLRQSELFGLKWGDINFAQNTMNVVRSIVYGVVGSCKTESSQKPVPVHSTVLETLNNWREVCRYNGSDDWFFASTRHRGRTPFWGQAIFRRYIRPVAQHAGIQKQFGWHTFLQTYSTLLRSVGTEFKVHAGIFAPFNSAIHISCLHPGNDACQTCSSGSRLVVAVFVRSEWHVTIVGIKRRCSVRTSRYSEKGTQKKGAKTCPFGSSMVSLKLAQVL